MKRLYILLAFLLYFCAGFAMAAEDTVIWEELREIAEETPGDLFVSALEEGEDVIIDVPVTLDEITAVSEFDIREIDGKKTLVQYFGEEAIVTLPAEVEALQGNPFAEATSVEQIRANEHFLSIDGVLFSRDGETILAYPLAKPGESYVVPEGTKTLNGNAFAKNTNIRSLKLPSTLETIYGYSFQAMDSLQSVNIPASLKNGKDAFRGVDPENGLTVTVDDGPRSLPTGLFSYANLLEVNIPGSIKKIEKHAFLWSTIESVKLEEGVEEIGEGAFAFSSLKSMHFPASLRTIEPWAFTGTVKMRKFTVESANPNFAELNGVLFSKDYKTLVQYPLAKGVSKYVVPDGVVTIGAYACSAVYEMEDGIYYTSDEKVSGTKLRGLVFPKTLKTIDRFAFCFSDDTSSLTVVDFYAKDPPDMEKGALSSDRNITVYAPSDRLENYRKYDEYVKARPGNAGYNSESRYPKHDVPEGGIYTDPPESVEHGVQYDPSMEYLVISPDNPDAYIDLSTETIKLPADFKCAAYSTDDGKRWKTGDIRKAKMSNLLNKGLRLRVATSYNKSTKSASGTLCFPEINARPKIPSGEKPVVNYTIFADPTGVTHGYWTISPRSDASRNIAHQYQITTASEYQRAYTHWGYFDENGMTLLTDKTKQVFYVRLAPVVDENSYTPSSKPISMKPKNIGKEPKLKADLKKETIKLKKNMSVFVGNSILFNAQGKAPTPTTENSIMAQIGESYATGSMGGVILELSKFIDLDEVQYNSLYVWNVATAKAPASKMQQIYLHKRGVIDGIQEIYCEKGKGKLPKEYEVLRDNGKWGSLPRITGSGTFPVRLKAVSGFNSRSASLTGTLYVEWGVYQPAIGKKAEKYGVVSMRVIPAGYENPVGSTYEGTPSGEGTAGNPYLIRDAYELAFIGRAAVSPEAYKCFTKDKHYRLANDVETGTSAVPWTFSINDFNGVFDGDGHTITVYAGGNAPIGGVFNSTGANAVIRNLRVKGTIETPSFGRNYNMGGIVGTNRGMIENCSFEGTVTGDAAGGIAYVSEGTIRGCYVNATINGRYDHAGGIVAVTKGSAVQPSVVRGCYAEGDVRASGNTGGIAGQVGSYSAVRECYSAQSQLSGSGYCGGIAGYMSTGGYVGYCLTNVRSMESGKLNFTAYAPGESTQNMVNNYAIEIAGGLISQNNCTLLRAGQLASQANYTDLLGWNFGASADAPWKWNGSRPVLYWQ